MADDSLLLDQLAREYAAEVRAGRQPDVEDYARRHPELAEQIRALFPTLPGLDGVGAAPPGAPTVAAPTLGAPADGPALAPGQVFNHFRIEGELGRGGMGVVYEAVHLALDKRVALKVLSGLGGRSADHLERFLREARTAAALHHTNIVPVFDSGQAGGLPYYAMEHIRGCGLEKVIAALQRADAPCPAAAAPLVAAGRANAPEYFRQVAALGAQAADALAYAHARGVIHRDVKPSNLLLDEQGVLWVTDFGLARRTDDPALTHSGAVVGTPRYMSPEQAGGGKQPVDHRTDVYSLGATLYELVTKQSPFAGEQPVDVLVQVLERAPPLPRRVNPGVPRDLETVLLKAMARRPNDRYTNADELAEDLRRFLRHEPVRARRIGPLGRTVRWCRRNPALAAVTAAALAVILTLSGIYYAHLLEENSRTRAALEQARTETRQKQQALDRLQEQQHLRHIALQTAEQLRRQADELRRQAEGERDGAEKAREDARDHLAHTLFERARALNASSATGRRWQALAALKEAEQLRGRRRKLAPERPLPALADLRSEAVAALLPRDARVVRELSNEFPGLPWGFSPDGGLAVSFWLKDKRVGLRVLDVADGREKGRWEVTDGEQVPQLFGTALALSPDGKVLATAGIEAPQRVRLIGLPGLNVLRTLPWPKAAKPGGELFVTDLAFSPDGKYLTGHRATLQDGVPSHVVYLWDLAADGGVIRPPQPGGGPLRRPAAFNARSTLLAYHADTDRVVLWDLKRSATAQAIKLPLPVCGTPGFSADDSLLAVPCQKPEGNEGVLVLWDVAGNVELKRWDLGGGLGATPVLAAFSPDGKYLAVRFESGQASLYDTRSGARLIDLEKGLHLSTEHLRLFWRDGGRRLVTSHYNAPVKLWELSGAPPYRDLEVGEHPLWPRAAALLAATPWGGAPGAAPWPALAVAGAPEWPGPFDPPLAFAFSADRRWLAVANGERLRLVRRDRGEVAYTREFPCIQCCFSPDCRLVAGFGLTGACVWDVASGRELGHLGSRVFDNTTLLSALLTRIPAQGRPAVGREGEALFPNVGFTADGRALALRLGSEPGVWDLRTGKPALRLGAPEDRAHLTARGDLLFVVPADVSFRPPKAVGGPALAVAELHVGPASTDDWLVTSPDGGLAAVFLHDNLSMGIPIAVNINRAPVHPRVAVLRLPRPGKAARADKLHELRVPSRPAAGAISPGGDLLALGFSDGTVQLWHLKTGAELLRWQAHTPPFLRMHLEFTPEGTALVGCGAQALTLWRLDLPQLRRELAEVGLDW
jgi:WD40 repeat protein